MASQFQEARMANRSVFKTPQGWADKADDASRPVKYHQTQHKAIEESRTHIKNQGGGEITIHGTDGRIRDKDTVPPGNDPCPPKDKR
jgi:hypothetical protein